MLCDMGRHILGQTILDPEEVFFSLEWATHVHRDVARRGITVDLVPEPNCRSDRADRQLKEVEQAGRHGGGDSVPDVGSLGGGPSVLHQVFVVHFNTEHRKSVSQGFSGWVTRPGS